MLEESEFETAMLDRLHLDLSPDELKRVWHMILKESGEAEAATGIHLNGFRHGVEHVAFLRHMVINLKEASGPEVQQYVVPASGAKGPPPPSEDSAPSATLEARGASLRRLSISACRQGRAFASMAIGRPSWRSG